MSNDLAQKLEAFAVEQGFVPQWPFYICGDVNVKGSPIWPDVYSDESILWCESCANDVVAIAEAATHRFFGLYCSDLANDGPSICPCGQPLLYRLTPAGISNEVEHFETIHIERLTGCQAYEIAQMLFAAAGDPNVLGIAHRAMEHLAGASS